MIDEAITPDLLWGHPPLYLLPTSLVTSMDYDLQTERWGRYPADLRRLADNVVMPWVQLTTRCIGPHLSNGPHGSYSLLEQSGTRRTAKRVVKVFIADSSHPLPTGVYVGVRSHTTVPGPPRGPKELRLWSPSFTSTADNFPYFSQMNPMTDSVGFTPPSTVRFGFFPLSQSLSLLELVELWGFIERCRQQYQ